MNYTKWEAQKTNTFEGKEIYAIRTYPEPRRIQRVADVFIEANAHLIATAVNGCISVNPDNPMAVAESIKDMYEALKGILLVATPKNKNSRMIPDKEYFGGFVVLGNRLETAVQTLAKAEGKEEK